MEGSVVAENDPGNQEEDIPFMQRLLDNPFILLFIGLAVPTFVYLIWGVVELISVPVGN